LVSKRKSIAIVNSIDFRFAAIIRNIILFKMKKLMILAFAAGSFMISCKDSNSDKSTTQAEQEVAAQTGVTYALDEANSSLKWKAYHKGGLDPRFGTVKSTGT